MHESGEGGQRGEGGRQADSALSMEPGAELQARALRSSPEPKPRVRC